MKHTHPIQIACCLSDCRRSVDMRGFASGCFSRSRAVRGSERVVDWLRLMALFVPRERASVPADKSTGPKAKPSLVSLHPSTSLPVPSGISQAIMSPPNSRYKVKPKRHHAYTGFIFVIGFLLPPFGTLPRFVTAAHPQLTCMSFSCRSAVRDRQRLLDQRTSHSLWLRPR